MRDRLGSVDTLLDATSGQILKHRGYDVFGRPRDLAAGNSLLGDWQGVNRGFTDHEHLADQELIHMNGRIYDFNVGRFLSVDPFLQFPENSQSANPYSYILNNPMSGTDPTGYLAETDKVEAVGGPTNDAEVKAAEEKVSGNGEQNEKRKAVRDNRSASKVGTYSASRSSTFGSYGNNAAFAKGYSSIKGDMTVALSMTPVATAVDVVNGLIDAVDEVIEEYENSGMSMATATVIAKKTGEVAVDVALKKVKIRAADDVTKGGDDAAKMSGMLRGAAKGKGNFGIGSGTREQADAMGKAWVGKDAIRASDGKTLVSKDGLRQYRPPTSKPNSKQASTGTQANFERRFEGQRSKKWQGNAHMDIMD